MGVNNDRNASVWSILGRSLGCLWGSWQKTFCESSVHIHEEGMIFTAVPLGFVVWVDWGFSYILTLISPFISGSFWFRLHPFPQLLGSFLGPGISSSLGPYFSWAFAVPVGALRLRYLTDSNAVQAGSSRALIGAKSDLPYGALQLCRNV